MKETIEVVLGGILVLIAVGLAIAIIAASLNSGLWWVVAIAGIIGLMYVN